MKPFVIIADGTCDLREEFRKQYEIEIIPGHIKLPDGSEIEAYLDWKTVSRDEFYADLKKNPNGYSTSPANVAQFAARFEELCEKGEDQILVMTISSGISGAFNFAQKAREETLEKYPEAKIICIDSLRFGPGFGLMAIWARKAKRSRRRPPGSKRTRTASIKPAGSTTSRSSQKRAGSPIRRRFSERSPGSSRSANSTTTV